MSMRPRKVKIELEDGSGKKLKLEITGSTSNQEIKRIYDFLSESLTPETEIETETNIEQKDTLFQRFRVMVCKRFYIGVFTSSDAMSVAEEELGIQFKRAIISTYLMRMVDRGFLIRKWSSSGWIYSLPKEQIITR